MYTDFSNDNVRNSSNEEITAVLEKKKIAFNKPDWFLHKHIRRLIQINPTYP